MRMGGWPAYALAERYGLQLYLVEGGAPVSIEEWTQKSMAAGDGPLPVEVEIPAGAKVLFVLDTSGGAWDDWNLEVKGVVETVEEADRWREEREAAEPQMNHSATPFILGRL